SEGAGNSAAALDEIAEIYQRRLGRAVDRITVLATPLAELVVGLVLLGLVLCYVFPTIYFFQRIMSFD
ncbi:MAG: type II secretion system F family protein, partial [Planctomycetota bacterium]